MSVEKISNSVFFAHIEHMIGQGYEVELKVKGTSMHPTLLNGQHKVVLVPYHRESLRVGSIALFRYQNKHILHRLVATDGTEFIFQGDNLPSVKEIVREEDIVAITKSIITPSGKIIDCRKSCFLIRNKLLRPVRRYYLLSIRAVKGVALKIFG